MAPAQAEITSGDTVWIGGAVGHSGSAMHPVYETPPADPNNPGEPDLWAYCVEHDVSVRTQTPAHVEDAGDYLGSNYFTQPAVRGKVNWVIAHGYPAVSLAAAATAAGVSSISRDDAIEATQYAIWRYTDLNFDAGWNWESPASEALYWYLVNGANASSGMTPGDFGTVTTSVTAPSGAQAAGSLAGPFTVHTNQASVKLTVSPAASVVDASGAPVNVNAVTDAQQIFLDLRGDRTAGTATVMVTAQGASGSGTILSVPKTGNGTPTAADHAQSLILIAASNATTTDSAAATWAAAPAPTIGTTLVDRADGDHTLAAGGGTLVDTIAYRHLTPGAQYTVSGDLMRKSDGSATGITGSTTFTPTSATGTVDVAFTIPAGFGGQSLVAFEKLLTGATATGTPVADHTDINDLAQTVTVQPVVTPGTPAIGTTLVDRADGDHTVPAIGGAVVDTIAYRNLIPSTQYTVSGELVQRANGQPTGIVGAKTFTPTTANGTVDVTFTVPEGHAGTSLVAFEKLFVGPRATGTPVADHTDINDVAQTVTLQAEAAAGAPSIGTTLVDKADGDHRLTAGGGTVVDTIAYRNLVPGKRYTVDGELMRKSDGTTTGIRGSATFTPRAANGTTEVEFVVPQGYAGETLVAYEDLYEGSSAAGTWVAEHKDIDDAAQSVHVTAKPQGEDRPGDDGDGRTDIPSDGAGELPNTGVGAAVTFLAILGGLLLAGGFVLVGRARARTS